ncbi:MAG TPA: rhodanese-like domain-containing protein [Streptosporangiaceae bacterium]|nr:rhodanese-like domain-containing protein [Streptosporangiaceae bacterium]
MPTIDQMLASARGRLARVGPEQAWREFAAGAVLVDIRPQAQRAAEGEIPGAIIIERNVLEWRFDPASAARLPEASYDLRVIVFCSEGYTSSLAAVALQDLGLHRATDLDGGFRAWERAGLPVTASQPPAAATAAAPGPAASPAG